MRRQAQPNLMTAFRELKRQYEINADYAAAKPSRFRRERKNLGGTGDAHYANPYQLDSMREYVRDMDRNDAVIGPIAELAAMQQMPRNPWPEPNTGDKELDDDIKERFKDWGSDVKQCDFNWERTWPQQWFYDLRETFVDGDIFNVLTDAGSIQQIEADLCKTPRRTTQRVIHGIKLDGRRKVEFWFKRDPGDKRVELVRDIKRVPRFDSEGNPQVLHIYNTRTVKRITQTRGVSAFAPIIIIAGMMEETNFAKVVQQQAASAFWGFLMRNEKFRGGKSNLGDTLPNSAAVADYANTADEEEFGPGSFYKGEIGEELKLLSANIPNPEYFQHFKLLLTLVGINLGLPLVMVLMDGSETNFSGWRGAIDVARQGFLFNHSLYVDQKLRPTYRWKIRGWLAQPTARGGLGETARRMAAEPREPIFRHRWPQPGWPYIQPLQDAQADALQMTSLLGSPDMLLEKRGHSFGNVVDETIKSWEDAIRKAREVAEAISSETPGERVHWREVLNVAMPDTLKTALANVTGGEAGHNDTSNSNGGRDAA